MLIQAAIGLVALPGLLLALGCWAAESHAILVRDPRGRFAGLTLANAIEIRDLTHDLP